MFEDEADVNLDELSFDSFILPSGGDTSTANKLFRSPKTKEQNLLLFDSPKNSNTSQHSENVDVNLLTSPQGQVLQNRNSWDVPQSSSVTFDANLLTSPQPQDRSSSDVLRNDLFESPLRQRINDYSNLPSECSSSIIVEERRRYNSSIVDENALMSPPYRSFPAASPPRAPRSGRKSAGQKIRKFPGPAGVVAVEATHDDGEANPFEMSQDIPFSQEPSLAADFAGPAWTRLRSDLASTKNGASLLSTYTVDWIKRNASASRLLNSKVPFLAALLSDVEFKLPRSSGSVRLVDPSGTIRATVQHDLHARLSEEFIDGAVVVLVCFGVFTVSSALNLTVTSDTLAVIYRTDGTNVRVTNLKNAEFTRLLDGSKRACEWDCMSRKKIDKGQNLNNTNVIEVRNVMKPKVQNVPVNVTASTFQNVPKPRIKNVEAAQNGLKRFKFTSRQQKTDVFETASSTVELSSVENSEILEDVFDGVDTDSFFEDF